ncbi:MAG: hypothetical protein AAF351_13565 [Pseudomonadota bacterium]
MFKKALNILTWLVGVPLGLAVLAYGILLIANLKDAEPGPAVAEMQRILNEGTPLHSENNAYFMILGFAAAPEVDPIALGVERHAFLESTDACFDGDYGEHFDLFDDYNYRSGRSDAVKTFVNGCRVSGDGCFDHLATDSTVVDDWLASDDWLIERYVRMTRMTEYREWVHTDLSLPLPSYSPILEAQRAMLFDAWQIARAGDAELVNAALDQDLRFWRMVLKNSDMLITKMIAVAAVRQHLKYGNRILRELPPDVAMEGIPPSWTPFTDEERSMRRAYAGETKYFEYMARNELTPGCDEYGYWPGLFESQSWDQFAWAVIGPFWQTQDTINRRSQMMLDVAAILDVSYSQMAVAMEAADQRTDATFAPYSSLFNFTGNQLMSRNKWYVSGYAARTSDLEGIRMAAVLATEFRSSGVPFKELPNTKIHDKGANPYTNEVFEFVSDERGDFIVFQGLEPHDRARHELIY